MNWKQSEMVKIDQKRSRRESNGKSIKDEQRKEPEISIYVSFGLLLKIGKLYQMISFCLEVSFVLYV